MWSTSNDAYAVLTTPAVSAAQPQKQKGRFGGRNTAQAAAAEAAANQAVLLAAARTTTVQVHALGIKALFFSCMGAMLASQQTSSRMRLLTRLSAHASCLNC